MSGLGKKVSLSPEEFINIVREIIERAQKRNIILRVMGAVAIYIHSLDKRESLRIYDVMKRFKDEENLFTDLDLIGYSRQRKEIIDYFEKELKYKYDPYVKALFGARRLVYYHPNDYFHIDIFFDKLEFSHDIFFGDRPGRGRLELDFPTISLADLVLEKLQIHEINRKDLIDLSVLFHGHELCSEIGRVDRDCIDDEYISDVLSKDWGFWYDATTNLNKLRYIVATELSQKMPEYVDKILKKIDLLNKKIDEKPKSKEWIKRSKIGTSKPWYREVEEIER
ncbi:MAG: hypothetical protein LM581_00950 [Desulfurococcales archaeon]|jgi:hypothetical protein|nr:hypothetical protein [Desulfurococcales archaeon]